MKVASVLLAWCCALLLAAPARADLPPRTFRLEVNRDADAEQCPGVEGVRDAIAVAAGVDPIEQDAPARLVVSLSAGGAITRGRWEMYDGAGNKIRERAVTQTGVPCKQLVSELVQTFLVFYETPPTGQPPPAQTCDAACRAKVRQELHAEVREEVRRELVAAGYGPHMSPAVAVLAGGLLSANYTADPGGGLFLAGELHGQIFSAALEGHVLFPSRVVLQPTNFAFEVTSITATLVPCARWSPKPQITLLGCIFVDIGALIANSSTVPFAGPPVVATSGLGPRFAVHIPFAERFGARIFADLRVAPIPSGFGARDTGAKWMSSVVSGLFGLGVGFE